MRGGVVRVAVQVAYRSQQWATVLVDLTAPDGPDAEAELLPAIALEPFGLVGPTEIACLSLRYHVAQKFHGMTKQLPEGVENDRFRDAVDLLILRDLLSAEDRPRLRVACEETFRTRAAHAWPPELSLPAAWAAPFEASARAVGLGVPSFAAAQDELRAFLRSIVTATEQP